MSKLTRRGKIELVILAMTAIIFGASVTIWLHRLEQRYQTVRVPRAAAALSAPMILKSSDIIVAEIPRAAVPGAAIINPDKLVGSVLTRAVPKDGWFTEYDLVYGRDPDSDGALVPPGSLGVVLPAAWFMGPLPKVKAHDFIRIYTLWGRGSSAGVIIPDAAVLRVDTSKDQSGISVLIAAAPDAAAKLTEARALQLPLLMTVLSAENNAPPILVIP